MKKIPPFIFPSIFPNNNNKFTMMPSTILSSFLSSLSLILVFWIPNKFTLASSHVVEAPNGQWRFTWGMAKDSEPKLQNKMIRNLVTIVCESNANYIKLIININPTTRNNYICTTLFDLSPKVLRLSPQEFPSLRYNGNEGWSAINT